MTSEAELERLGLVASDVRDFVIERDGQCCRVCGQYVAEPALHHIEYRSQGGLDVPSNLVTIGWMPWHDCHLSVVHANKRLWQPLLLEIVDRPWLTGLAALRWRG